MEALSDGNDCLTIETDVVLFKQIVINNCNIEYDFDDLDPPWDIMYLYLLGLLYASNVLVNTFVAFKFKTPITSYLFVFYPNYPNTIMVEDWCNDLI